MRINVLYASVGLSEIIICVVFNATFGSFLVFCEGFSNTTTILFSQENRYLFFGAFNDFFKFYSLEDRFPQFMVTEFLIYLLIFGPKFSMVMNGCSHQFSP